MTASEILIYIAFFCAALLCLMSIVAYREFEIPKKPKVEA